MLTLLLLCLCLSSTFALPPTSSLFMGRSADIIIESETQQNSVVYFKGEQFSTTQLNELEDTTFADLFAHVMGTQPFNVNADRTGFPTSSLFYKPRAALLVAVDSVGSEILNKYPTLSFLQNSHASSISTSSNSPANTLTLLANMVTGTTPSQHGIVGPFWRRPVTGTLVQAYGADGMAFSANIADILLQETQGRSLVISASSSSSFSSALGAHPEIVARNDGFNAHAYSFVNGGFSSRYSTPSSAQILSLTSEELSALLSDVSVSGVTFSTKTPEDLAFLAELAFVRNLINKISSDSVLSALVKDDMPDLYSFVFASLKGIQATYGENSETFAAALSLADKAASSLLSTLNANYDGRVASAFIALNARDVSSPALKDKVHNKVSSMLHSEEDFELFYPALYVRTSEFSGYGRDIVCANLQQAVSGSNANVFCGAPIVSTRSLQDDNLGAKVNCSANGTDPYAKEKYDRVWAFWLNFFVTLIIACFIGWGVYCLAWVGSDASQDSLLFRAAGRHHHQN